MRNRSLFFLLLLGLACTHGQGLEQQNRLSITLPGEPASKVGGIIHTMMGLHVSFENKLITKGSVYISLHEATTEGLLQALAHGSNGWWWFDRFDRRYHISTGIRPQISELPEVRSHPSSLINRHDLDPIIRRLMEPWTQQKGHGLASIPWTGQWSATLPAQGHSQLTSILRILELGDHAIPSPLPFHDLPPPDTFGENHRPFNATSDSWADAMLQAAEHFNFSISISPTVAQLPNKRLNSSWTSTRQVISTLRKEGFSAKWISGVLCVDLMPIQRRTHPIFTRRVMLLPVPHLINYADGHILAAQLKNATPQIIWSEGGRLCTFIQQPPRLLIAIEEQSVNTVLDALDRFERSGSQSWEKP